VAVLRVGVDATSWSNRRGFGRFARNAVERLVALDPDTSYVLYVDGHGTNGHRLPEGAECRRLHAGRRAGPAAAESSRGMGELLRMGWDASRDRLDAFLFPSVYSYFPLVGVPVVVGVHDVIADELPELTLPNGRSRALWRLKESLAVRRASRVFTVSAASRSAVASRFGIPTARLAVVPEAPDPVFHPRPAALVRGTLAPLGLEARRFLLYAGGISPHKDIETLLDAFAALARRSPDVPPLVLVGDLEDASYMSAAASVRSRIAELGIAERVVLPGFVSDEELACLYAAATAVAIPSLAEGFGLPAVEAAASGTAVVVSDLPAHRETLDGAALFFPPRDRQALEAALRRVVEEEGLRRDLAARGRAAVEGLSWDATAERLGSLVAEAARS
jgi:glycosyltransferase involved in cell wall biosynthesis